MSTETAQQTKIALPEEVDASKDGLDLVIEGPNGSVAKRLWYPNVSVEAAEDAVVVATDRSDRATAATMGTFVSHIENMVHGVLEGWEYRMRIVYSHFPMQVSVQNGEIVVENFVGERSPRRTNVHGETDVEIDEDEIILRGPDKEAVGQTAADLEQLTRIRDKDIRVFQDGAYITEKPRGGLKYE